MSEFTQIEIRRKSRSKTPFLRSSCDNDACTNLSEDGHIHERRKSPYVKKNPKILLTIEESNNAQRKTLQPQQQLIVETGGVRQKSTAITTSDYSSNSSEDLSIEHMIQGVPGSSSSGSGITAAHKQIITTTTTTTAVTKTHNKNNINNNNNWNQNEGKTSIRYISKQHENNKFIIPAAVKQITKEMSQNEINTEFEKSNIKTSTPIYNQQIKKTTVTNSDISPAYKEYQEAGEYWSKYPKTDYTYSKLSPHRREVVPGVVGMPNMSRNSLEKHHKRINYMIERNPEQESYLRNRYEQNYLASKTSKERMISVNQLLYDSQDEVDMVQYDSIRSKTDTLNHEITSNHSMYSSEETWITKSMSFVVTIFNRFCKIFSRDANLNKTKIKRERGDKIENIKNAISKAIFSIFSYFYLLILSVLYLDTLLLQSPAADNTNKKRFLLLMLILLPLVLLAGAYYHINPNEPFPPVHFSELSDKLQNLNLTQITQFVDYENIDQIKANTLEKIDNLRVWSEDYFDYIKTVSYNVATETQKIFMENFSN